MISLSPFVVDSTLPQIRAIRKGGACLSLWKISDRHQSPKIWHLTMEQGQGLALAEGWDVCSVHIWPSLVTQVWSLRMLAQHCWDRILLCVVQFFFAIIKREKNWDRDAQAHMALDGETHRCEVSGCYTVQFVFGNDIETTLFVAEHWCRKCKRDREQWG